MKIGWRTYLIRLFGGPYTGRRTQIRRSPPLVRGHIVILPGTDSLKTFVLKEEVSNDMIPGDYPSSSFSRSGSRKWISGALRRLCLRLLSRTVSGS